MGIRSKLVVPLIIGLVAFILFLHFYWVDNYLDSEYRDHKKTHKMLMKMLEPELTRAQISGDLAYMHSFLDQEMELHKKEWQQIAVYDHEDRQLYPLTVSNPALGKYVFGLRHNLYFDGEPFGRVILTVDWKNERQEELQRIYQIEQLLIIAFSIIIFISIFWQNHLVRTPLIRLKKAATKLSEGDYTEDLPKAGKDEVGQLTHAFEKMRSKLERSHADLKQALTDARTSEAQQRSVINTMADALIIIDEQGIIQNFNPAAERIFGYDAAEVLDQNIKMLMPEPYASTHDDYLSRYRNNNNPHIIGQCVEVEGVRKNGVIIAIELRISEIDMGETRMFSGIIRDISERKRTETELRIAAIAFDTQEGIIITDPDANIVRVNQACTQITGYDADELIGHNPRLLQSGRQSPDFYTRMWDSLIRTGRWSGEIWNRRKNGEIYLQWASLTAVKDEQDNVTHYVGGFLDISELKEQQLQLEYQTQELSAARDAAEAAARAKSEFLSIMSHEIRTPLNGILGMAQLLTNTPLDEEQNEYLHTIIHSGNALLTIIDDVLDFSKMEAEKMDLEQLEFNLEQTAFEVINLLSVKAKEKNLDLVFDYAPDCPRHLLGDAGRIRQILINLIGNAIKFTEQGHVLLEISCLGESGPEQIGYEHVQLNFKVKDTGVGISPENQFRLFDSFSQADGSTTRKFGGTGLGLAICKKLVTLMGGDISIESSLGNGATFLVRINLPVAMPNNLSA